MIKLTVWIVICLVLSGSLYWVLTKLRLYFGRFNYHSEMIMELKEKVKTLEEKVDLCPESKHWKRGSNGDGQQNGKR